MTQGRQRSAGSSNSVRNTSSHLQDHDLLLRETNHRCNNDLQLVVSLLALQSQRVTNPEARQALTDAMEQVNGYQQLLRPIGPVPFDRAWTLDR